VINLVGEPGLAGSAGGDPVDHPEDDFPQGDVVVTPDVHGDRRRRWPALVPVLVASALHR